MLSLVLLQSFLLSLLLLHVHLLALKLRDTARAGRCGLQEPAARQGFALHAVPGWEDGPESSSPAQTRKAEPEGLTAKDPAAKKQFSHRRPKSRRVSSRLPRLLPSFACRLQPQGCHSCVLSLWKLNARVNGVSPERGARRGRPRGPSRASSHGRLCSPPGASPEHPPHLPSHCPHLSIPSSFPDFSGLLPWQSLASIGSL